MSEMLTLTVMVSLYTSHVGGLVVGSIVSPITIAVAVIVIAALITVGSVLYLRGGKKKTGTSTPASGTMDWQRQAQAQQGVPGTMQGWPQQGMPADNAWGQAGQSQANAWATQPPSQQPGSWDAQQQSANAWGAQNAMQPQSGGWGAQNPAQSPGWGAQAPAAQQQSGWGAQNPGATQQPGGWGTQTPAPQQSGWGAQNPAQAQQQPGWGTPGFGQQPQPSPWGNSGTGQEAAGQSAQAWESTAAPSSQDRWAQPQSAPVWGAGQALGAASPAQQQNNSGAFGGGSGQSWGQPQGQAQAADPWAQPMPAGQSMPQAGQGGWAQPYQGQAPASPQGQPGNPAFPSWQQPGPGMGQGQPGFGSPSPFGSEESDRTMLRNTGAPTQNRVGIVRIEEGKEPGRVYPISKDSLSIGRSRESDIFLEDLAVSRLHASIINMGNGNYALRDEGSANGTKVNGQTVNKYQPFPLNEGDKIQLGQTVLVFAKR